MRSENKHNFMYLLAIIFFFKQLFTDFTYISIELLYFLFWMSITIIVNSAEKLEQTCTDY